MQNEALMHREDLKGQGLSIKSILTLVLLDPDIYGFKHILSQIICHWNGQYSLW